MVAAGPGDGDAHRRRERLLELVPRRRRLPRPPPRRALSAAPAAMGPVRLLHAADAGAWALRAGGLALRPPHARHLPRVRPAPRAARSVHPSGGRHGGAHGAADIPPALPRRSRGSPGMDPGRLVPVRAVAVGRAGGGGGSDAAQGLPAAGRVDEPRTARRTPAGATSWSRRPSIGSASGCGRARWWSPTRPSTSPAGLGTRPRPIVRWRRPYGAARRAGGLRRSWPMAPRCAGAAEAGASAPRAAT